MAYPSVSSCAGRARTCLIASIISLFAVMVGTPENPWLYYSIFDSLWLPLKGGFMRCDLLVLIIFFNFLVLGLVWRCVRRSPRGAEAKLQSEPVPLAPVDDSPVSRFEAERPSPTKPGKQKPVPLSPVSTAAPSPQCTPLSTPAFSRCVTPTDLGTIDLGILTE